MISIPKHSHNLAPERSNLSRVSSADEAETPKFRAPRSEMIVSVYAQDMNGPILVHNYSIDEISPKHMDPLK